MVLRLGPFRAYMKVRGVVPHKKRSAKPLRVNSEPLGPLRCTRLKGHTHYMPRPGDKIHIPLPEREAVRLLGKVKPTADMPRPGASKSKAYKKKPRTK